MNQPVSASKAKRNFSRIIWNVRAGQPFEVMVHRKPVARIVPCTEAADGRNTARAALFERLGS